MKITITPEVDQSSILLIPILSNDKLESGLKTISRRYGLDYDLLLKDFSAQDKEVLQTYLRKKSGPLTLFLIGLGDGPNYQGLVKTFRSFFKTFKKSLNGSVAVSMRFLEKKQLPPVLEALTASAVVCNYDLGLYKTSKDENKVWDLKIVHTKPELSALINRSKLIAETQVRVMDLVNAPANKLTPDDLAEWAKESGKKNGFDVSVMTKDKIVQTGLNALLAVNQGSELAPTFIIAEYKSVGAKCTVGLVGKGVTFDTGGLSIKGSANMHYMKSDMGGAAAVLGAIEAAAKLALPINIIAIVPATENSVDAKSVKPGDIIDSYSGKTIEVIDTDAEGRLILSDALSYHTKNYKVDYLIDFATLTGSVIGTLGFHAAGLFTNSKKLNDMLLHAGDKTGERLWPLPLWEVYEEDLESDVADIKNYSGKPLAGAITAAKFLEVFTNEHPNWAHIDIAGTAFGDTEFGKQKNATGFGIQLTIAFLEQVCR